MSLFKKTLVLSNNGVEGYITIVKLGSDAGAKIVGSIFTENMKGALRIANNTIYFPLNGELTEIDIPNDISQNDKISCTIVDENNIIASVGKIIDIEEINSYFVKVVDNETVEEEIIIDNQENEFLERLHKTNDKDFYLGVKKSLEELFIIHPPEKLLANIIPHSRWAKINYDGTDYYVVGEMKENDKVKFICYGVPGKKNIKPPKFADSICDWLPVSNLRGFDGYYLIFQNANDGTIANID